MIKRVYFLFLIMLQAVALNAQQTPNEKQARRIFDKTYNMVFGPQGATLHYDVNIIGMYKTQGTIWYKGKKQKFVDEKVDTYNDGQTCYMAYRKKRVVEIHDANSDKKDKYSGKFKFTLDDFTYHIAKNDGGYMLTLKQKRGAKGTIKEVRALVDSKTYAPIRLRVKVAFIWTTISVSNFRSGGIDDAIFTFPRSKYGNGWKYVDKR